MNDDVYGDEIGAGMVISDGQVFGQRRMDSCGEGWTELMLFVYVFRTQKRRHDPSAAGLGL